MLTTLEEWTSLFADWTAAARIADPELPSSLSHPPATLADIAATEARLKLVTPLPPSYRAFLLASNGWQFASRAVPVLRSLARLTWFKKQNRDWIAAYTDPALVGPLPPDEVYFCYSAEAGFLHNPKHLSHTLQISDVGDAAVFLLNPMVIHADGEWEAWFFANWLPGVQRYRSFATLMRSQYRELAGDPRTLPPNVPVPFADLPTVYRDPPTLTARRVVPRKPARPIPQLLRIAQDHSWHTTMNARIKAIQELAARRDPATIAPLRALIHDPLREVGASAMIALGTLGATEVVPDLIAMVRAEDGDYACALASLGAIGNPPALDFLIEYLDSGDVNVAAAARALAPHGDPRGAVAVLQILLNPADTHTGAIAGRLLAGFGAVGLEPLTSAASHGDLIVRRRAYGGLFNLAGIRAKTPEGIRAGEALRACRITEPDPKLASDLDGLLSLVEPQQ